MATVAAIFDDSDALEKAVNALEAAGLGDDIVEVAENTHSDTAPETSQTADDAATAEVGAVPIAGAGLAGGGAVGAAPLGAGMLGAASASDDVRLDKLGSGAEPFRQALEHGGKVLMLETNDVDTAVSTLQSVGAQEIYDPR